MSYGSKWTKTVNDVRAESYDKSRDSFSKLILNSPLAMNSPLSAKGLPWINE
jgi:hypothetical protein